MSQPQLEYGSQARASSRADRLSGYLKRRWPILIIPIVVLASLGIGVWRFVSLKVDEPAGYSPASVVKEYTDVAAPPAATNIKTAGYSKGPIWSRYLRFQAPTDACLAYARTLAGIDPLAPAQPTDLDALLQHDSQYFKNFGWFDLPQAVNLVAAHPTAGAHPGVMVYVDQARGVVYFYNGF